MNIITKKTSFLLLFLAVFQFLNAQDGITPEEKLKMEANKEINVKEEMLSKEAKKLSDDAAATQDLLLGLPKISDKTLFIVSETALKINGLKFVGFCEGHKLGMFKYDQTIFKKPEDVIKAFEKENVFMPMYVKEGSFKDVEDICQTK